MKTRCQLIVICGVALLVGAVAARPVEHHSLAAAESSPAVFLARADGPVLLGARPLRVRLLSSAGPMVTLAGVLRELKRDQRLWLVVRRVSAERPPGVLFQIFLNLPDGAPVDANAPNFVGTLNFFRALPAAQTGDADPSESFDITDIARSVASNPPGDAFTTVAVVAVGPPAADALTRIGSVEIVQQ